MRIYSDTIQVEHLVDALHDARAEIGTSVLMDIEGSTNRARKRKMRHDIRLEGIGARHTRWRNTGRSGSSSYDDQSKAATWMDWGWLIAVLFRYDRDAVIGQYDGRYEFHERTAMDLPHRMRLDPSVKNFARECAAIWDGTSSPFLLVDRLCPPNRLINLRDTPAVEQWLGPVAPVAKTATCVHCQRHIVLDPTDGWVDPEAPTDPDEDDHMWRETCDRHETFHAVHEPWSAA